MQVAKEQPRIELPSMDEANGATRCNPSRERTHIRTTCASELEKLPRYPRSYDGFLPGVAIDSVIEKSPPSSFIGMVAVENQRIIRGNACGHTIPGETVAIGAVLGGIAVAIKQRPACCTKRSDEQEKTE